MTTSKTILISTLATSLLVLAGCTTQTTTDTNVTDTNTTVNTNAIANTNTTNDDTNDVVANENTNVEQGTEVDTSDWLTYTNDEYGFSFRYPSDWLIEEQFNKLTTDEKIRIELTPNNYIPDGSEGDMLYNSNLVSLSFKSQPLNYYGTLLLNSSESEITVNGIVAKKVIGEVYEDGPKQSMIYLPNESNSHYITVVLNVDKFNYATIFDQIVNTINWTS